MIKDFLSPPKRIVLKVGSAILKNDSSFNEIAKFCSEQISTGNKIIIVTSGAIMHGKSLPINIEKKDSNEYKQAFSALGQMGLLEKYKKAFLPYYIPIAQILLTNEDFDNSLRYKNILNTLTVLTAEKVVAIINENDTISTDEITFGDNDFLSIKVASLFNADLVIMLSDGGGIKHNNEVIQKITEPSFLDELKFDENSNSVGTGGIKSKIEVSKICLKQGMPLFITGNLTFQDGTLISS